MMASTEASFSVSRATPGPSESTSVTSVTSVKPVTSVAEDAEDAEPSVVFTTFKALYTQVARSSGDILIVKDVSPDIYVSISRKEPRPYGIRLAQYSADTRILIITIPTKLHERLHRAIEGEYMAKLANVGLQHRWVLDGSATFRRLHGQNSGGGDGGEGDSCGGPFPPLPEQRGWPTLMLEAGHSQSLRRLRIRMKWWFEISDHKIRVIIIARFDHRRHQILLENWEEERQHRSGATMTRASAAQANPDNEVLMPVKRQMISITRNTTTNPPTYNVTRGALSLRFHSLFRRDPDPTRGEGDFIWTTAEMEQYAEMVWSVV